ncbi:glutathione S-transferase L2, chloroplastic-like isoform X2 [Silene latifolia]|uniref:glutathione S-transferase L2, chloroplastic-like isoform X2 n=1 Tax=Silene latifolia TaxID=37657 RepID=UPI003D76EDC2
MGSEEVLLPVLNSTSKPPPVFDGTTRLYTAYTCPFAQRVWIARNYKVPCLEHNNKIKGESLDLVKYLDSHFQGPSLYPDDAVKLEFAQLQFANADAFGAAVITYLKGGSDLDSEICVLFDKLEEGLSKFNDGPFFLGRFSAVDIAYAPFIERYQPLLLELKSYEITETRPKLGVWIKEMDKIDAYKQTKRDSKELTSHIKRRVLVSHGA